MLDAIESLAHRTLQESYDNSGLQAGDVALDCSGVLLTLDVTEQTVDEAIERNLNLIISHHPLLFKPVKQISPDSSVGRILMKAIRHGIAIYSAHPSLDNAWGGVSHRMAEMLGMTDIRVLEPQTATLAKVVVFVPTDYADTVADAMFAAGAGQIGDYDSCSYRMQGMGSFRALDAARINLYISAHGTNEHHKIEGIFKALARAIKAAARRDIFNYTLPSTKGAL